MNEPDRCKHRAPATVGGAECRAHPPTAFLMSVGGAGQAVLVGRFPPCAVRCGEYLERGPNDGYHD